MTGYRIISERELNESFNQNRLLKNEEHPPYHSGQVICFFQGENYEAIFNRYASTLADLRSLKQNDLLYLLKLNNLEDEKVEIDSSQNGWENSFVYLGDIDFKNISVLGFGRVLNGHEGFFEVSNLEEYSNEMSINEIIQTQ